MCLHPSDFEGNRMLSNSRRPYTPASGIQFLRELWRDDYTPAGRRSTKMGLWFLAGTLLMDAVFYCCSH
jgi:hypothetical protein